MQAAAAGGRRIGTAVVGCGPWGRNLVRTLAAQPGCDLRVVCDLDPERLAHVSERFPRPRTTTDFADVLADDEVEAVLIATSSASHHALALAALRSGRATYVEKPLALCERDAAELVALADARGLTLMVGHLMLHHPAVLHLSDLVARGELGDLLYAYSQRVNLGVVRRDENALWSFGPHDVSVMDHLMGGAPETVSARGQAYLQPGVEDVVFLDLRYPGGRLAHVQLSWLDPHKLRRTTVVGSRKMAVFDDMEPAEKIRIYDKGAERSTDYATFGEYLGVRHGDVLVPRVPATEPLAAEVAHFVACVRDGTRPRTDGRNGLEVVRVLAAASRSLSRGGLPEPVGAAQ